MFETIVIRNIKGDHPDKPTVVLSETKFKTGESYKYCENRPGIWLMNLIRVQFINRAQFLNCLLVLYFNGIFFPLFLCPSWGQRGRGPGSAALGCGDI